MSDIVNGKDVAVFTYDGGIWKLYGCATSCTYIITTETIETSVAGKGLNATYLPTKNSFNGSISGLMSLEPGAMLNYPDLQLRQVTHQLLMMRYVRTSPASQVYTSEANFYIISSSDTGSHDAPNAFDIEMQGTGIPGQVFQPQDPSGGTGEVFRYEYTAVGNESFFASSDLANKFILEVNKDGAGFSRIITSGTPVNKEAKYTIGTGRIDLAVPAEPGEEIYVLYQELL